MKLDLSSGLTREQVGEFEELQFNISEEDKGLLLAAFADGIYSNKIDSLVRELTSNAIDSHIEAGIKEPVIVTLEDDFQADSTFSVKDTGVGISPERVVNVFVNYFKSTKRDSNLQIGGFGIGAKSPLSYTDAFYVITVYDNVKYTYIVHKGTIDNLLPRMVKLSEEQTSEHNGTEIRVPLKNRADLARFREAIKRQLAYFDNVFFVGAGVDNDFKVYEGKYFKIRDKQSPSEYVHICLGDVYYPLNFSSISEPELMMPIALKFDIGELTVTINREQIEYKDEAIKLIQERYRNAMKEIVDLYNERMEEIKTLEELHETQYSGAKVLRLGDEFTLKLDGDFPLYGSLTEGLYLPLKSFIERKIIKEAPSANAMVNAVFEQRAVIKAGKTYNESDDYPAHHLLNNPAPVYRKKRVTKIDRYTREWIRKLHGYRHVPIVCKREFSSMKAYKKGQLNVVWASGAVSDAQKEELFDAIDSHLLQWGLNIPRIEDFKIPEDFKAAILVSNQRAKVLRGEGEMLLHTLNYQVSWVTAHIAPKHKQEHATFHQYTWKVKKLAGMAVIVWGNQEDRDSLLMAQSVLLSIRNLQLTWQGQTRAVVGYVAKESNEVMKQLPKAVHVNDFLMGKHKLIQKAGTAHFIKKRVQEVEKINLWGIYDGVARQIEELKSYVEKYGEVLEFRLGDKLAEELTEVLKGNRLLDPRPLAQLKYVEKYLRGCKLLPYIEHNEVSRPYIVQYLISIHKHVNREYYELSKCNEGRTEPAGGGTERTLLPQDDSERGDDADALQESPGIVNVSA